MASKASVFDGRRVQQLDDVLKGAKGLGRMSDDDITIADLTGIAAQDIAIARVVLEANQKS